MKYGVGQYFFNSIIVTVGTVIMTVLCCSLASYVLSRFEFKGKKSHIYYDCGRNDDFTRSKSGFLV